MMIDLSADDLELLRESLELYLTDFRRQVAATENPEFRHQLQQKQNALERILSQLAKGETRGGSPLRVAR
jgi:hypothetical protein